MSGGYGGDASDIRTSPSIDSRIIVAAGGGGTHPAVVRLMLQFQLLCISYL